MPASTLHKITEQTTLEFRRDLNRLGPEDRARIAEALRHGYESLRDKRRGVFARVQPPHTIHLKGGLNSSLRSLRVGRDLRLIMAIDDDPVFGRILVTLFRVVRHSELDGAYRLIARLLYGNQIQRNGVTR